MGQKGVVSGGGSALLELTNKYDSLVKIKIKLEEELLALQKPPKVSSGFLTWLASLVGGFLTGLTFGYFKTGCSIATDDRYELAKILKPVGFGKTGCGTLGSMTGNDIIVGCGSEPLLMGQVPQEVVHETKCPDGQDPDTNGKCPCPVGQEEIDGKCQVPRPDCPPGQERDAWGNCKEPYKPPRCPPGQIPDGNGCKCPNGEVLSSDGVCTKPVTPCSGWLCGCDDNDHNYKGLDPNGGLKDFLKSDGSGRTKYQCDTQAGTRYWDLAGIPGQPGKATARCTQHYGTGNCNGSGSQMVDFNEQPEVMRKKLGCIHYGYYHLADGKMEQEHNQYKER